MKSKPPKKKSRTETPPIPPPETNPSSSNGRKCTTSVKALMAAKACEVLAENVNKSGPGPTLTPTLSALSESTHDTFPKLSVPELTGSRDFPRLSNVLSNPPSKSSDLINLEEVDALQIDLENLWTNLSKRIRFLEKAHNSIASPGGQSAVKTETVVPESPLESSDVSENEDIGPVRLPSVSPVMMGNGLLGGGSKSRKVSALNAVLSSTALKLEKCPKKKLKGEGEARLKRCSEKPARSGQNRSHWLSQEGGSSMSYRLAPNQFWDFAENYCRQLTYQDLDSLEKIIEDHSSLTEAMFEIPPLGPHFKDYCSTSLLRKRDRIETRSQDVCGPLTQRLVSALVDHRIASFNQNMNLARQDTAPEGLFVNRPGLMSALGLDGGKVCAQPLETRLRQVLLEQGLLMYDETDVGTEDSKDEILSDVKKTQAQLRRLHKHNEEKLKQLYILAKRELDRVEAKRGLEKADKELLEAYRIVCASRSKKKPLSKREREVASRALENRRNAMEKLQTRPYELPALTDTPSEEVQDQNIQSV